MGILRTAVSKLINAYIIRNPVDHYLESPLFLPTPDLPQGLGGILHPDSVLLEFSETQLPMWRGVGCWRYPATTSRVSATASKLHCAVNNYWTGAVSTHP